MQTNPKSKRDINMNLDELINSMTAEQIKAVMAKIASNGPRQVSTDRRAKRIARTALYHNSAPKPHMCNDFADYVSHSDSIRTQVIYE